MEAEKKERISTKKRGRVKDMPTAERLSDDILFELLLVFEIVQVSTFASL